MSSCRTPRSDRPWCSRPARPTLAVLALCLLATVPALSALAQEGELSTFLDSVDVNLVNLEVFVTDRQGNRIDGLTREDFEVRVDGEPVELTNFFVSQPAPTAQDRQAEADQVAPPAPPAAPPAPAVSATAPASDPAPSRRRPLFLVAYVDNLNILPANRKRLLDDLRPMLDKRLAAGDQVMLVSFDRSAEIVQPFTRDAAAVGAGLDRIERSATRRQVADTQLRTLVSQILRDLEEQDPWNPRVQVDLYQAERENEAMTAYKGLQRVVTGLAGLPGRKALLYISDGIPRYPGAELETLPLETSTKTPERGHPARRDLRNFYRRLIREANAHEVTLYTFDARGATSDFGLSADNASYAGTMPQFEFARDASLQEPLLEMAQETGGDAIINTFNFSGQLDKLVRDFQSYYSLGFPSPNPGDGKYHNVKVRVKRPGVRVRHRDGYLDKTAAARVADRTESFLLQGWESNPMGVQLQFGEPKKKRRTWRVPVLVRVPADAVTLIPRDGEMAGRLQLIVAVRDDEGRVSEPTRLERNVRISAAEMEQRATAGGTNDLGYALELEMRAGLQSLVVGVWDEVGGSESYVHQRVAVGDSKP